ncbi:hypothetical protein ABEX29_26070, partial [Brevibacillus porteri]|uniref:hypothetical protein n=1 Tax=Brevibacillus porteri TaxID=2126350 RepID=UPI003D1AEC3A
KLVEETGEISEDLRDTDRDAMQKAKHALKRPPLKMHPEETTLDAVSLFAGVVPSIPQGVALEAERFLLFPPHHNSNVQRVF